jgi:hypothetical protein
MTRPPESNAREAENETLDAYTIKEFCRRHSISRSTYYAMRKKGTGPVESHANNRVIITKESALAWRLRGGSGVAAKDYTAATK